jgi:hypothetical protein
VQNDDSKPRRAELLSPARQCWGWEVREAESRQGRQKTFAAEEGRKGKPAPSNYGSRQKTGPAREPALLKQTVWLEAVAETELSPERTWNDRAAGVDIADRLLEGILRWVRGEIVHVAVEVVAEVGPIGQVK